MTPGHRRLTSIGVLLAAGVVHAPAVDADVLHLKGNRQVSGTIVEERADDVLFELAIGRATFPRSRIVRIERGVFGPSPTPGRTAQPRVGSSARSQPPATPTIAQDPGLRQGDLAPDFAIQGLDGRWHRLDQYRGKPLLLNFTATWCGPCQHHTPALVALATRYQPRGVSFLSINLDRDRAKVTESIAQHGIQHPVAVESDWSAPASVARKYGPSGIPRDFFIGPDGRIRLVIHGANDASLERLKSALEEVVDEI